MNLIILAMDNISEFWIVILSGLAIFAVRAAVLFFKGTSFDMALAVNLPSLVYYMIYAFLVKISGIKKRKDCVFGVIILLSFVDFSSNLFEAAIRNEISPSGLKLILLVGFLRSLLAYFIYELYQRQKLFILSSEHQKRYTQLNMLISNIQAEMFYLKKSMKDIENVMRKSYSLYESHELDNELKEKALDIAKDVHEIKKDYYRVIIGFESFLKSFENEDFMKLSDIFTIIKDNIQRYLKATNKEIKIFFSHESDFSVGPYYNMFTLLNNLLTNSIDACKSGDTIAVVEKNLEENVYFEVKDSGEGIEEDILPYIFNPGFTTKYDENTGSPHTGIGLSHVKNIVEELGGSIEVDSKPGAGTKFKILIPKKNLVR
ncbi:sensor histidine kinase [Thermosediminibacter litoriperuensis]|uniref:sensor histidine kinase n=1 Tax=Thermosediminibacter litoriperuensis TaxID=291989 RepID=UPI0014781296|nr:sensor histidine kinase [Thermosediminibacter litoriperuensis]